MQKEMISQIGSSDRAGFTMIELLVVIEVDRFATDRW
jgi:type II secretory pathway pseudopilin PulG